MWGGATTRSQLRKSINSLYTRHVIPEAPAENPISSEIDQTRHLIFSRERDIASNLAFLSATSDDYREVMAVCVEEHRNGEGITIRIASNSGDPSAVRDGFIKVAGILEQAARRGNSEIEDIEALLRQVVVLDMDRILSRLRSRHSKSIRPTRQPFVAQLHSAINDKSLKSTVDLTNGVGDLQDLFTQLEDISDIRSEIGLAHRLISDIVRKADALIPPTNLSLLLKDLKLNPSLKSHLPNTLGKLGRYYSAASWLVCAARNKKCRVFQTIAVEPVKIDVPHSLENSHVKVHAEIQLLFFYEMHPELPRPQVICSSKSACYLCNLFFRLHGVFYIPRSHGRLYDKWTLPDWLPVPPERRAELGDLVTRLDVALKARMKQVCFKRENPIESVLSVPGHLTPSTISKASSLASTSTVQPRAPLQLEGSLNGALSQLSSMPPTPPGTPPSHMPSIQEAQAANCAGRKNFPAVIRPNSITLSQLPFSELITAATPPLYLHLDNPPLTLDFDFSLALPCRLQITPGEEEAGEVGEYRIVEIEDIPTASEMQVSRLESGGKVLKFKLRGGGRGGVCVAVIWGGE
ncbi:hypothetical protein V496_03141 [Pseudogymnoascus sp. VKM F-4515 (FW-2607)]|nr:hypothetical protein V496_03141 [Pseudogymnoascus sp. VKM F-4515 (FW-2607)]